MRRAFDPTQTLPWKRLAELARQVPTQSIAEYFEADPERSRRYSIEWRQLLFDYSKNLLPQSALNELLALADSAPVSERIAAMFDGAAVNVSENRAALHVALRDYMHADYQAGGKRVTAAIAEQQRRIERISAAVRDGRYAGANGGPISDILNIGIGGSDLGPRMVCRALETLAYPRIKIHFIANVDGTELLETLEKINPETTLAIISSKTFSTAETLLNAKTVRDWFERTLGRGAALRDGHFIGVTANRAAAESWGLPPESIIDIWDWVGGRYSLWSGIGLPIAISLGYEKFRELLDGARAMDAHFRQAPFAENIPVMMGLIGLWYANFLNAPTVAVVPYCQRLELLVDHLQQLEMESNGKSLTQEGEAVDYATGPIIWGQTGANAQHSFFQLLHQGTHLTPVDFIGVIREPASPPEHHKILLANLLAQSAALMRGQTADEIPAYMRCRGNRPSNILLMECLTPFNLGALIAAYEHKVLVQSSIWNINPFDQGGVDLGKKIARQLCDHNFDPQSVDASTRRLYRHIDAKGGFTPK